MGLGSSFGISSETNNNIVTDGLILDINASYKKSYPKSGTALTDLSGNHANGTLTNGPTFSDSFGGAINLDGTNDFISTDTDFASYVALTVSVWLDADTFSNYMGIVAQQTSGSPNASGFGFPTHLSGNVYYFIRSNSTDNFVNTGISYPTGLSHMVLTWNSSGGANKFYLNGELKFTNGTTITDAMGSDIPDTLLIGAIQWSDGNHNSVADAQAFDGKLYNVQLYNKELTAGQVLQNYNAQKQRFGL